MLPIRERVLIERKKERKKERKNCLMCVIERDRMRKMSVLLFGG